MILIAYRHGLRASELTNLRVSDVNPRNATIYCCRAKGSRWSIHPMKPDELRTLESSAVASLISPRLPLPVGTRGENESQRVLARRSEGRRACRAASPL